MDVDGAEFGGIVHASEEHALLHPIALHDGRILDSRNRHRARRHATAEPRVEVGAQDST